MSTNCPANKGKLPRHTFSPPTTVVFNGENCQDQMRSPVSRSPIPTYSYAAHRAPLRLFITFLVRCPNNSGYVTF